ncbi:DUF3888 domain-containing protein [Ureibacillus xyleni]|nr:DUF3888 domain-containing protein [Ureibacillus xyleni]
MLTSSHITHAESDFYQPPKESKEELVMDMFFSLLLPDVQKAVSKFYSDSYIESPLVYPYQINILKMERTNGYRGFMFSVVIEVTPVFGAHNPVGKDQLTFSITSSEVELTDFKHLEDVELPPHLQDLKKR